MLLAYSYIRFSSPEQAKGDSLRRQTEAAAAWCDRNGVSLDTGTTFRDLGKSAYTGTHRNNPDRHALAAFLKLVETGKVPRGSHLIIENLDRLTREHIQPALLLVLNLLQSGIRIVQLSPSEFIFDDKSDTLPVMMMIVELSRGHGESLMKSNRLSKAWKNKKLLAREARVPMTASIPLWLEMRGGKIVPIPEHAATVRRIFDLTIAGYGLRSIVRLFEKEKVATFGDAPHWSTSYISRILRERRAMGEFQPMLRKGHKYAPDGPPIPNYFPAIVTEEEWLAARQAARKRGKIKGRKGETVNAFAGLLQDAVNGGTFQRGTAGRRGGGRYPVIFSHAGSEGRAGCVSFPFDVFEKMILHNLREIPASAIISPPAVDPVVSLASEHATTQQRIREIEMELERGGDVSALARVLRRLEERETSLASQLAEARVNASSPLAEAWSEARTLLDAVEGAADPDDARLRLRAVFRRTIAGIWVIVVALPGSRDRICAAQVHFHGSDAFRTFLIAYRPARGNGASHKPARCEDFTWPVKKGSPPDFRNPATARIVRGILASVDADEIL